jgi:hypothetical protein
MRLIRHKHLLQGAEPDSDPKFIIPPLQIPLVNVSIFECNPENDIITTVNTIQVFHDSAYLYNSIGTHLHTIPLYRLKWLWNQYHKAIPSLPPLEPPLQSFETEVIWLLERHYTKRKLHHSPHHLLPPKILDHIISSFNLTHSYFSSPFTCSTLLTYYYSQFQRDCIFGSLGPTFSHKWQGPGFAHPPPSHLPQTIH